MTTYRHDYGAPNPEMMPSVLPAGFRPAVLVRSPDLTAPPVASGGPPSSYQQTASIHNFSLQRLGALANVDDIVI